MSACCCFPSAIRAAEARVGDPPLRIRHNVLRLTPVMRALDPEVSNVVVQALAEALADREAEVQSLVAQAGSFLNAVADREDELAGLITHGAHVIDAYAAREQELRELIHRFANVSETVAERNEVLIEAISRIADAEAELHRLAATNEDDLRRSIAQLDRILAVLSGFHEEIELIAAHTGTGIVQYHRISRWGQWFNIRVPGLSAGEVTLTTERGAVMPPRMPADAQGEWSRPPSGAGAFFAPPTAGGDAR
jgi:ABC-type transporter Mla subunit MlaD